MAKQIHIMTQTPMNLENYERRIKEEWEERAKAKNDRIVGEGYAERQIAATLSQVEPIDLHVSKIGKNMEDLVKRGHVVDALADSFEGDRDEWREFFAEILADVPEVKTAKHGKWVRDMDLQHRAPGLYQFFCSCCYSWHDTRSPFCPNCGANMRGKK